ncbi:NK-tumor recognition protein isoform X2 [Pleurodeles waltl]|uniref:NK-tumor recognition protein isoform X2 n=1 Tax=Pleurodeles waltl TaxID=8319 RepID=UPI003709475B
MAVAASAMGVKVRPQCYFDIEINREPVGRIIFQLFSDVCQKTCKNFLYLCTGQKGTGKTTGKRLCYKGSTFHRVVKNFMIQGGDFSEGNGKGGESIYGGYFKDENFILKHDRAFLLSMANRGKHTNGSQFFITTRPAPHLDNVHVVFGLVISGFEVIETIENLKTDAASRPYADVRVIDCGLLQTQQPNDERSTCVSACPEAPVSKNITKVMPVPEASILETITKIPSVPEASASKKVTKIPPSHDASISKKISKCPPVLEAAVSDKIAKVPSVNEMSGSEKMKVPAVSEAPALKFFTKAPPGQETLLSAKSTNVTYVPEATDSSSKSATSSDTSISDSDLEVEKTRKRKRKRKTKMRAKHEQKRRKEERRNEQPRKEERRKEAVRKEERRKEESKTKRLANQRSHHSVKNSLNEESSKDLNSKREKPVVRPEEIPPVPENKFLLRRAVPVPTSEPEPKPVALTPVDNDQKPSVSKSGRKIKGRGTMRYHTPPRSRSCSESEDDDKSSETPPHWKEEMQRVRAYQPSSGEKWSKGDKLNDGKRREHRSLSQRSRSWSHDGYYSDLSKEKRKKDKRSKHKKKSKKQKQSRKIKQPKPEKKAGLELGVSRSSLKRTKSSHAQERRSSSSPSSSSVSSRPSSKREWSKSDKEQSYSSSSRKSKSYSKSRSRSYSREHSRSRTASESSTRTRSRSSSRSRSRSRSSTRSRTRSKSSSRSRHRRSVSKSPKNNSSRGVESKSKKNDLPKPVVEHNEKKVTTESESVPLMPLSDSPPPSRWKPGLKPWKPSYERIQEIKAKASSAVTVQSGGVSQVKQTYARSYNKRQTRTDSDQSEESSGYRQKSKSRSSRSRSYTRSYSRSRSRTSSRSGSRYTATSQSQNRYHSANSSCSRSSTSDSDNENVRRNHKMKTIKQKKNLTVKTIESSSESILNSQSTVDYNETDQSTAMEFIDSIEGKSSQKKMHKTVHENATNNPHFSTNKNSKCDQTCASNLISNTVDQESALGSDANTKFSEKPNQEEKIPSDKHPDDENTSRPAEANSKVESTPVTEKVESKHLPDDPIPSSGKEEGEASSDSEMEVCDDKRDLNSKPPSPENQKPVISDKNSNGKPVSSDVEKFHSASENRREKSKKHKHRSTKKNLKKARLKKTKEKARLKKEKKEKHQRRKPALIWQPPLEFGEEEEEEVVIEKPISKFVKKDKRQPSENKTTQNFKTSRKTECTQLTGLSLPCKEASDPTSSSNISNSATHHDSGDTLAFVSGKKREVGTEGDSQSDDDMDICTPDHSSPENNAEVSSPAVTAAGPSIINSGQPLPGEYAEKGFLSLTKSENEKENLKVNDKTGKLNNSLPLLIGENNRNQNEHITNSNNLVVDNKWKPVQGPTSMKAAPVPVNMAIVNTNTEQESKPQGVRIEIKSKNRVRPGSLFDEVRKTARLNRRPRNQESSSDESSLNSGTKSLSKSPSRSRSRSNSCTNSHSYSRSRSRSRSSSYTSRSRSYTRSHSRRRYSRHRTRGRSYSSDRYRSRSSTYSRSRSRSRSYSRHRRSRSRSYTYDSYSRSRSRSKRSYSRSRSYDGRSRHRRSYASSRSDRSYSFSDSTTDG